MSGVAARAESDGGLLGSEVPAHPSSAMDNQVDPSAIQTYFQRINPGKTATSAVQSTVSMSKPGKAARTNVLTGASSTSYQRPVIWAGQYMGLVSYQVQKENDENEK